MKNQSRVAPPAREPRVQIRQVVRYEIEDDADTALRGMVDQRRQRGFAAEALVDIHQIGHVIAVIALGAEDRRQPHDVHSEVSEIRQRLPNTVQVAPRPPPQLAGWCHRT